jgi:signal transduction histidine kinase
LVDTSRVSAGPVRGDREELRRLVRNLLENAVRYAATTVRVTLHTEDSTVRLVVSDDGPGVDPVDRAHVFDRFYRADTARSRGSSGSGLGLAIAAAIATRHGGTISLQDSEPGAEFLLVLPMGDLGIATSPRSRVMP